MLIVARYLWWVRREKRSCVPGVHIRPIPGSVIYCCDGCVVSSKDINPAKSASYNWDEAGNSVSFNLNLTAGTDPAVDCQA